MPDGESEKLVEAVADRVREALAEADRRAEEVVDEATRRAEEIVSQAEARAQEIEADADARAAKTVALSEDQARERIERARKALDELGVALGTATTNPGPEEPSAGSDPEGRSEAPQPEGSDPSGSKPTTDELIAQLKGSVEPADSATRSGGDETAARLVAMNMALDGSTREEVDAQLAEEFGPADRGAMLDEVFDRAGR